MFLGVGIMKNLNVDFTSPESIEYYLFIHSLKFEERSILNMLSVSSSASALHKCRPGQAAPLSCIGSIMLPVSAPLNTHDSTMLPYRLGKVGVLKGRCKSFAMLHFRLQCTCLSGQMVGRSFHSIRIEGLFQISFCECEFTKSILPISSNPVNRLVPW